MDKKSKSLPLTSVDVSFAFIALAKKLISKDQHRVAFEQILTFRGRGDRTTMEELLQQLGLLSSEDVKRVVKTQSRHLRICMSCQGKTYRLPNQNKEKLICESCEGPVRKPTDAERLVFQTLQQGPRDHEPRSDASKKTLEFRDSHEHLKKFLASKRARTNVQFVKPVKPRTMNRGRRRP